MRAFIYLFLNQNNDCLLGNGPNANSQADVQDSEKSSNLLKVTPLEVMELESSSLTSDHALHCSAATEGGLSNFQGLVGVVFQ